MRDFSKLPDVTELHPELETEEERLFAAHMKAREEAFAAIFGPTDPPDQILSPDDPELMINWPGGGVYAFPPGGERKGWHYATHGLAQPFGPDEGGREEGDIQWSGLGIELVIATPDRSEWAPSLLIDFVRYLLFQQDAELVVPGDRIPTSAFKTYARGSELTHVIATLSPEYDNEILLPAGRCTLVHLVGVTTREIEAARPHGGEGTVALGEALRRLGPGYTTDTARHCTADDPAFGSAFDEALRSLVV